MKKILLYVAVVFSVISCLDGGSYSQSYTADITFEFSKEEYANSFKDSLYVIDGIGDAFLYMGYPLFFAQKHTGDRFQSGFLMSYLKGEANGKLDNEPTENDAYRVHAASGALDSQTYAVYYDNPDVSLRPEYDIQFAYVGNGTCAPLGCYVNNTTLVARKIKEHFKDGDRLVLHAKGKRIDGTETKASIVLAEYTEAKDSVMYNWSAFSLTSLGQVDYVDFEVVSTNPEVPGYFCLDGYVVSVNVAY